MGKYIEMLLYMQDDTQWCEPESQEEIEKNMTVFEKSKKTKKKWSDPLMVYKINDREVDKLTEKIAKRVCNEMPELPPEAYGYIQCICHDEIAKIIKEGLNNEN